MRIAGLVIGIVVTTGAAAVLAQPLTSGTLRGDVVGPYGEALAGVEVTATSISGYEAEARTGAGGTFVFERMNPGTYQVGTSLAGFEPNNYTVVVRAGAMATPTMQVILQASAPATLGIVISDSQGGVLPGVFVEARSPDGATTEGVTGADGRFRMSPVAPGEWEIEAALAGFSTAVESAQTTYGSATEIELTLELEYGVTEEVVVLGSRRPVGRRTPRRLVDAPVTTTIIPRTVLETTPSSNMGDILRNAPSVNAIQLSVRDVQVTTRQSTGILSNSQLVLVDGRTIYLDFFGTVLWDLLPIHADDIEQMEIVRGPASATWGANAMTGAVHVVTREPRQSVGTTVTMTGGWIDQNAGASAGQGHGSIYGANASINRAPSDKLAYRISGGYFHSDAFPRPQGRVPLIDDPRVAGGMVGGAPYPGEGVGPVGTAFVNRGTTQPKFDARVEQELDNGARLSYSGGVAATEGLTHTGLGPFDMKPGTHMAYGKLGYNHRDLRIQVFTNLFQTKTENLLLSDPLRDGAAVESGFTNRTVDADIGHSTTIGSRHVVSYGGNVRRNTFDIDIAPNGADRFEMGAYIQDEVFFRHFRIAAGGRLDKFGTVAKPFLSPRVSLMFQPTSRHSLTVAYNRAFRSPSVIENWLQMRMLQPIDLSDLAFLRPLLDRLIPQDLSPEQSAIQLAVLQDQLDRTTAQPFPLLLDVVGSEVPFGTEPRTELAQESLTAYELSYTGNLARGTTIGGAVFVNRRDNRIKGGQVPPTADPYTENDPPEGWILPADFLTWLAPLGLVLPKTGLTFVNRGPTEHPGAEVWIEQRVRGTTAWANYSWQGEPQIIESDDPFPEVELDLPPTHRFNIGLAASTARYITNVSLSMASRAFWADVLTPAFHGYSDAYKLVNASLGRKWNEGRMTTTLKVTNLFNQSVQQHVFGDILRRTVVGEVRFAY